MGVIVVVTLRPLSQIDTIDTMPTMFTHGDNKDGPILSLTNSGTSMAIARRSLSSSFGLRHDLDGCEGDSFKEVLENIIPFYHHETARY